MYGTELLLDLHSCNNVGRMNRDEIEYLLIKICDHIGMEREDLHFWESDPANYHTDPDHLHGTSAVQFITTSTIVIHTLPKMKRVYMNIFTCGDAKSLGAAATYAAKFFDGVVASQRTIPRQ